MPIVPNEPRWRRYLRFWRADVEADVDDEIRFHFEARIAELVARGHSPDAARGQAVEEFGDVALTRQTLRTIDQRLERSRRRSLRWDALCEDLRYAARGLRTQPKLSFAVVFTLALGVGATVSMYDIVNRVVFAPPPHVVEPATVGKLYFTSYLSEGPRTFDASSYPHFEELRRDASSFAAVAAYMGQEVAVGSGAEAHLADATLVSGGYWTVLRPRPAAGRFFADEEAHPASGSRVVVLGHGYWRRRFGGEASAVGRAIEIKGNPYLIVGVAPRGFRGAELEDVDLWLPLYAFADGDPRFGKWHTIGGQMMLRFVARRRSGVTEAQASARATSITTAFRDRLDRRFGRPSDTDLRRSTTLAPLTGALGHDMQQRPEARIAVWLAGVSVVLLLVACANVATLLLLRALRRRRELAIRLALGMNRRRLATLLFSESALLAVLGGLVALTLVVWGGAALNRLLLPDLSWDVRTIDRSTLGVALACVVATAVLSGLGPMAQGWRDQMPALKDGGERGATRRVGAGAAILVFQIGLSVVLLVGSGLFLRSLHAVESLDHGMDLERVLAVTLDFSGSGRSPRDVAAFYERAHARAADVPGVERASIAHDIPLRMARGGGFQIAGRDSTFRHGDIVPSVNFVTSDFFATTGMRVVRGRVFAPHERGTPVAVVNEAIEKRFWPDGDAVGACIYASGPKQCTTIVGVVATARRFHIREDEEPYWYRPLSVEVTDRRVLLARIAPGAEGVPRRLASAIQSLEPGLPFVEISALASALDPQLRPWRLGASVLTIFAGVAALLVVVGLYSAVAYAASARTREIGIRIAVGARARHVVLLVLRQGLLVAVLGVLIGIALALAGGRYVEPLLFEVSARDLLVFVGASGLVLFAALVASSGPAWRARRVDPARVLRTD